jgi:hypothetical protein
MSANNPLSLPLPPCPLPRRNLPSSLSFNHSSRKTLPKVNFSVPSVYYVRELKYLSSKINILCYASSFFLFL